MVGIQSAYRNDLHTCADDGIAVELLLQPELLKCHFTAAFHFLLVLSTLFFFDLDGRFGSAVLKFNLGSYAPAMTEVITHINDHMRQVKLAIVVICILLGILTVPKITIAEKAMFGGYLTVSTDDETSVTFLLRFGIVDFRGVGLDGVFGNLT